MTAPRMTSDRSVDALPTPWQRLLALSGVASAVLLVVGFLISGSDAPDYMAADQDWTNWAIESQSTGQIGALLTLAAGFVFLHFAGMIRTVLGSVEATVRGAVQLARVAFAGALIGIAGITMAIVTISAASVEGADADPVVSRAVATATTGMFLVAAMGFAAMLAAAGVVILRSGIFARWIGIVALIGALAFFLTFFTLVEGTTEDSVFGYGFFAGFLALGTWLIATSMATYRAVATIPRESIATQADS